VNGSDDNVKVSISSNGQFATVSRTFVVSRAADGTVAGGTITNVDLVVTAPAAGSAPSFSLVSNGGSGDFSADRVSWAPLHPTFRAGVRYTATVQVKVTATETFGTDTAATLNTFAPTRTITSANGRALTVIYTFPPVSTD
jgi:hypothetical protein